MTSTGWYHDVFENNWAVKLLIDPTDGRIVDANPAACTFYGYDRETFRTLRITDINLLAHEQVHEQMGKARQGTQRLFDFPHRLADGDIRWVQVHSGPLEIEGRTLLFSIIHDITPLEKARVALNESEARYRALVESSEDVIFQVDRHGRFAFINAAGARLLGRPKDDILNHGFSELLEEDAARIAYRLLEQVIRTGSSATAETRLV
ncbi:MAG: PAS domain-containing protein, partial [Planctomycetota bacterium]